MRGILNTTHLKNWLPMLLGTAVFSFGLHVFVIPNQLMEGGVTGIALLLNYILGLPMSLTTLVLNIPLFLVGFRLLGRQRMIHTIAGVLFLALSLYVMEVLTVHGWLVPFAERSDMFLAVVYAGVSMGTGLGIVFRYGGTTGGVDIVARILQLQKGWSIGRTIFVCDAAVMCAALLYLPRERILYTLVAAFIASKMIDLIGKNVRQARAFMIISKRGRQIAASIVSELDRGATIFPAKGAYAGADKEVVYCIISHKETTRLKALVQAIDPDAFTTIGALHEVQGEGFTERF